MPKFRIRMKSATFVRWRPAAPPNSSWPLVASNRGADVWLLSKEAALQHAPVKKCIAELAKLPGVPAPTLTAGVADGGPIGLAPGKKIKK